MKISTENDNNFGYEKIAIVVDNIPLNLWRSVLFVEETGVPGENKRSVANH
jgi:hypothetical protein